MKLTSLAGLLHLAVLLDITRAQFSGGVTVDGTGGGVHREPKMRCGAALDVWTGTEYPRASCYPGLCCSQAGYCGVGPDYCSVPGNCQRGYGRCDSDTWPKGNQISEDTWWRTYDDSGIPFNVTKCTKPRTLALTYDDGPSDFTSELLDVLFDYGARATFFVASNINGRGMIDSPRWASTILRMYRERHQIGSHTWSHPHMSSLSSEERREEMLKTEQALKNVLPGNRIPTFMRAPYIDCDLPCQQDVRDLGYHLVTWQYDSEDWQSPRPNPTLVSDKLLPSLQGSNDSMLLIQHDIHQDAVLLTKSLLSNMPADWRAVTLADCLGGKVHAYRNSHTKRSEATRSKLLWTGAMVFVAAVLSLL